MSLLLALVAPPPPPPITGTISAVIPVPTMVAAGTVVNPTPVVAQGQYSGGYLTFSEYQRKKAKKEDAQEIAQKIAEQQANKRANEELAQLIEEYYGALSDLATRQQVTQALIEQQQMQQAQAQALVRSLANLQQSIYAKAMTAIDQARRHQEEDAFFLLMA